jgi:hypothetical protein
VGITINQALLDRATAYVAQPLAARRYEAGLAEVTALYSAITGQPAATCRQCQYSTYLAVVQAYIRQATRELHPDTMPESKYSIAPGLENETFVHEGLSEAVTAENLTDKTAEFLMKHGFEHAFVLKSGAKAEAEKGGEPAGDESQPTEREQALQTQLTQATEQATKAGEATTKAKAEASDAKKALKAEKDAHAATSKELAAVKQQLADTADKLAQATKPAEVTPEPEA